MMLRRAGNWLPRFGLLRMSTPGLMDVDDPAIADFEGSALVIQWGRFVIELSIARQAMTIPVPDMTPQPGENFRLGCLILILGTLIGWSPVLWWLL